MIAQAEIIGGGIGGLAAALCLAQIGVSVRVYEQAESFGEVGAGLQIGPNGMHVLRQLGLEEEVQRLASHPQRLAMRDGLNGRCFAKVPFGGVARCRYGAAYVQIHRADLLSVLAEAAQARGVQVAFGEPVSPAELDKAQFVVAADGVRSGARSAIGAGQAPRFSGHIAWRALVPAGQLGRSFFGQTNLFVGPGRHVVLYPLRGDTLLNIVAVEQTDAPAPEHWMQTGDAAALRSGFADWCPMVREALDAVGEVHRWGLNDHPPLDTWHDGARTVLLGDACHPMLPYLAQGAVMALEDAACLANCLRSHPELPAAFAAYEAARKPRVTRVQERAAANGQIYHASSRYARAAMHQGLNLLSVVPGNLLLRKFDWLYGEKPADTAGR